MWVLLALMAWPFIEIGLFVEIGGRLGLWSTLGLVMGSAFAGVLVLRTQGARAQAGLRAAMEGFANPAVPLAHEALILVAGGLLILPGFFSDAVGLLLLIPPLRALVIAALSRRVVVQGFTAQGFEARGYPPGARPADTQGPVIEGDFQEIEAKNPSERGTSGWTRH